MTLAHDVLGMTEFLLARPGHPIEVRLQEALRLLCKYRSQIVAERVRGGAPPVVRGGPFAGMLLPTESTEGCYLPKLLGIYEQELEPILARLPQRGYQAVLNVGCSDGYYAVGLARMLPAATVAAHDIREDARATCAVMARANGAAERVRIGGEIGHADFADYADRKTLVVCDIEGAENDLLDPEKAPALAGMDLLVEVHDVMVPGTGDALRSRFAATHDLEAIGWSDRRYDPAQLPPMDHLDQLLCVWEWRLSGTDWLWMTAR